MNTHELKSDDTNNGGDSGRGSHSRNKVRSHTERDARHRALPARRLHCKFQRFRDAAFRHTNCISTRHSRSSRNACKLLNTKDRVSVYSTLKTNPPDTLFLPYFSAKHPSHGGPTRFLRCQGKLVRSAFTSRVSAPAVDVGSLLHRFACGAAILFGGRTRTIRVRTLFIGSHLNPPSLLNIFGQRYLRAVRATMTIHHLADLALWLCCTGLPASRNTTANFNLGGAPLRIQWKAAPGWPGIPTW